MGATIWWFVVVSIGEEKWAEGVAFINQAHVRCSVLRFLEGIAAAESSAGQTGVQVLVARNDEALWTACLDPVDSARRFA